MSRFLLAFILFAGLIWSRSSISVAQECPPITVTESPYLHEIWYGYENPEMIPDHHKFRVFMLRYNDYLTELVQQLTPDDHAILMDIKSESDYWRNIENERYSQEFAQLCANSKDMDPVATAGEYERIALESNNRISVRIKEAVDSLSPTGREAVLDYVEYVITPELQYPKTNSVTLAVDDPADFLGNFEIMCYISIYGEPPPEIKRAMECYWEQTDRAPAPTEKPAVGLFPRPEN